MQPKSGIMAHRTSRPILGILSFVSAILALFSDLMITLTSLLQNFNPPDWIRVGTMAPLPLALVASVALGVTALKKQSGRVWAIGGLTLSALVIIGFVILLITAG